MEWEQLKRLDGQVDYALPQELVLLGAPENGLADYKVLVDRFNTIECLDFKHCHDLTTEILDILCKGQ